MAGAVTIAINFTWQLNANPTLDLFYTLALDSQHGYRAYYGT